MATKHPTRLSALFFTLLIQGMVFGLMPSVASASVLVSQTATSSGSSLAPWVSVGEYREVFQTLGNGLSGVATSASLYIETLSGTSQTSVTLQEFSDSGYTTKVAEYQSATTTSSASGWVNFAFSSSAVLSDTKYYRIRYAAVFATSGTRNWKGVNTNAYLFGEAVEGTGVKVNTLDTAFILYGTTNTQSRVISSTMVPYQNYVTPSSNVTFTFDYFSGSPAVDRVGYELRDLTAQQTIAPKETDILLSGTGTFATTTTLSEGHSYVWTPYVRKTSDDSKIYGASRLFFVVENTVLSDAISLLPASTTIDDSVASSTELFAVIPSVLRSLPLFSFLEPVKEGFDLLFTDSGVATSSLVLSYDGMGASNSVTIDLNDVAAIPLVQMVRDTMGVFLYAMFMYLAVIWVFKIL